MASVKYGSLVTEIIGSVGGQTFQRSRNGFSVRNKPRPRNTRTANTSLVRSIIAAAAATWPTLSDVQRLSWNVVAPNWPAVDHFGDPVILSGYNTFVRSAFGLVVAQSAPSMSGINPASVWTMPDPEGTISISAGTYDLDWSSGAVGADTSVILWMSQPVSPGRAFAYSNLRLCEVLLPAQTFPYDFQASLIKRMGVPPPVGSKIWMAVQSVSRIAGNIGMLQPFPVVVGA